jgi:hypothetical protein
MKEMFYVTAAVLMTDQCNAPQGYGPIVLYEM